MKQLSIVILIFCFGCTSSHEKQLESTSPIIEASVIQETALVILGTAQDAGVPQIGCGKKCCAKNFRNPSLHEKIVSLGLIIPKVKKTYLFEATPNIATQIQMLSDYSDPKTNSMPDGIFVSHAHIGHYTGLMQLGKEAQNADAMPVYAMPKMSRFLEENGPWSQLITENNIRLQSMDSSSVISLPSGVKVYPILVPHRDEYSETVGFKIIGPNKSVLFIPDIDKWERWDQDVIKLLKTVDYALLDGTFYDAAEINHRDISTIPHPFVIESMELFGDLPLSEKNKIHFIHFNHTNPLLNQASEQYDMVEKNGFHVAETGDILAL
jgi:pyrroloquinoline quinone biosynthesis protein B